MQESIWHLLSVGGKGLDRKTARTLSSEMDVRGTTRALKVLARRKIVDATIRSKVEDIAGKTQNKILERNRIIHGFWDYDKKRRVAIVREYRASPELGTPHDYTLDRLKNFASGLMAARQSLQQLLDRV